MPFEYFLRPSGVLDVEGPDRETFLQGQLTQDVRGLAPGEVRSAAALTPRGKLIFLARLVAAADRFRLVVPAVSRSRALDHLKKYAVFQKVTISDRSEEVARLGTYGGEPPELPQGATRVPGEGEFDSDILVPAPQLEEFQKRLALEGARSISPEDADVRRIEAGRPRFGAEADENSFPDELLLEEAISRTKGCYVGQEIVARMKTYGRVNRRLVAFRFPEGSIGVGERLRREDETAPGKIEQGRVTSAVLSPRLGAIGLGFAFRDVSPGTRLVAVGDPSRGAVVCEPGFPRS